jgi:hypothetical protein
MTMSSSPKARYKTRVEDCDVIDHAALAEYRAKRDEWLRWYELSKDEPNSIQQQLFSMHFLDMTYRIISEARQVKDSSNSESQSALLSHLLDQGYVATQVLAIRRLLDGRKDVISVRRLLGDILKHRNLLTRENYVCYDGLPYDSESWQTLPQTIEMKIWKIDAPGLGKYLGSSERHKTFDSLSGVAANARKRDDLIQKNIFDEVEQWLDSAEATKLITLSHKFFAHAADMDSLGSLQYSGIALADISAIQRAIIRVERAITDKILFIAEGRDVVPMPPLGLFKGLDNPVVQKDAIDIMYERWRQISSERNEWSKGIDDDLFS